ncbi:hypothetical protein FHR84_000779 [Actinopolyspora biskrensis]|uniref:Uncharacterized protein n=1 Tax=Actinopolyspora biskrensis TaxID=1470178 RepID=A0A852YX18_9ACTN|nr:hypothetical protein [Actinopolyspora biskrensis]
MFCGGCDLKFEPTKSGKIPRHHGNLFHKRWTFSLLRTTWEQPFCANSGIPAKRGATDKPKRGDSVTVRCPVCEERTRRSRGGSPPMGVIRKHLRPDGADCTW